ncbi:probable aquaporin SIP2-1 isoform X2 [Asparagus officinalis]|uniref:probable aquaporin SIP2-1 isoform X2 n=1 Tax=Asparagus officinalis TaxID=4686 RepID=UPI00098E1BB4|nr:probable aquaporin SIP2-1 isoform X2 [Asparagus officinalis]
MTKKPSKNDPIFQLTLIVSDAFVSFIWVFSGSLVIGSIIAVWLIMFTFPEAAHPPHLNVDINRGTLTEGLLAFTIVTVSLTLKKKNPKHSATKTWIKSISKVVLHLLGSEITGGMMNPAAAFGWAYFQGNYNTKEHLYVYWLAPFEATLMGVWTCNLFVKPRKQEQKWKESSDLNRIETFGLLDAEEVRKGKSSCSQLFGRMDMHFYLTPRAVASGNYRKRSRTLQ